MLFYLPELIIDHFTTRAMYVVLRSLLTSPSFIPWPQICLYLLMIFIPGASNPLQCMSFHASGLVSGPQSATSCVCCSMSLHWSLASASPSLSLLSNVTDVVSRHCIAGTIYVILCSRCGQPPLHHRHNVCYSVFLIWSPALYVVLSS